MLHCFPRQDKKPENENNTYNHNFLGKYCTCDRPYPDLEPLDDSVVDDQMLQCVVCEDWFHERHLGRPVPDEYEEMVCDACVKRCPFLHYYSMHSDLHDTHAGGDANGSTTATTTSTGISTASASASSADLGSAAAGANADASTDVLDSSFESSERQCDLEYRQVRRPLPDGIKTIDKASYFREDWRLELCSCAKCLVMYEELNILFLPDASDTTAAYEELGQANSPSGHSTGSLEDQGVEALSSLPVVQQVEMSTEYNNMKSELTAFLKPFADSGKTVSDEDIRRFFDQLKDRKRRPGDGPPPAGCGGGLA
eukprot:scpid64269/ scgid3169/ Putative E3 ubiquitin-protein ligase UBR7; N-recognin-7